MKTKVLSLRETMIEQIEQDRLDYEYHKTELMRHLTAMRICAQRFYKLSQTLDEQAKLN